MAEKNGKPDAPAEEKPDDETKFNETLKRMLETPPKPHDKAGKEKGKEKPETREKPSK